jgi:hypothetical protein
MAVHIGQFGMIVCELLPEDAEHSREDTADVGPLLKCKFIDSLGDMLMNP